MLKYPILHSGFIVSDERNLLKPKQMPPSFGETILFMAKNREHEPFFYSEDITSLFLEWRVNPHLTKNFDFKERILRLALSHFGTYIGAWCNFQSRKPTFSYTHRQFLDTLMPWTQNPDLVETDPGTDAIKWLGLLAPSSGHDRPFNFEDETRRLFAGDVATARTDVAIHNWVTRQGGYESLLTYLFIIFGERTGHTQTPPKTVA